MYELKVLHYSYKSQTEHTKVVYGHFHANCALSRVYVSAQQSVSANSVFFPCIHIPPPVPMALAVAFVTGSNQGLGFGLVKEFVDHLNSVSGSKLTRSD